MTFAEILPYLQKGFAIRREQYDSSLIIFKQLPATINDVTNIKSLPNFVKQILSKFKVGINYDSQYVIYDFITGDATHCVFDGEDIDATDWIVVSDNYDPFTL